MAYIFDRFPRMVRDLSKEEDKDIELEISGSDIGLDRTILDEINDPLIHLLRNAVSHGIEEPKERQKNGKSKTGHIRLSAQKERNFVLIEVSDDGAGMDVNEVKQVAVKKKLIGSEEVSKLSDEDAMMLITQPGFSTSKKVTETSGRGVGMNTVRSKVESFGGSLTIETKLNKGSKFTLKLPVSMAILQALLVKVASEIYAIPLTNISETIKIDTATVKIMEHHEVIPYRDEVLPLVRLRERFGFAIADGAEKSRERRDFAVSADNSAVSAVARIPVVVVEIGRKKVGFVVDALVGQQEVVIKSLTGDLKGMPGVAGATIMGDGRVAMIVDVPSII
jgi:two-component system chemotaxis sensor kinase CheA